MRPTRLREWRHRRYLSQNELAQRAKITRVTLTRIELGAAQPQPATLRRLADALGVETDDLFEQPVKAARERGKAQEAALLEQRQPPRDELGVEPRDLVAGNDEGAVSAAPSSGSTQRAVQPEGATPAYHV